MSSRQMEPDRLAMAVQAAIQAEVAKIADEEAEAAAKRVHARVRARVNEISVRLFGEFDVRRDGMNLLIRVKYDGLSD